MELTTLCTLVASLSVVPNRSQFFLYESVAVSCEGPGNASSWRVKRNTATHRNEECSTTWGTRNESRCFIDAVYQLDNGAYWCELGARGCSHAVNITVTGGSVILESPVLPVNEGEAVTLRCLNRTTSSSSSLPAQFYKDGLLIGSSPTGRMTIHGAFKSHEGLYKCSMVGAGESPDSWLSVRGEAGRPEWFHTPLTHTLLPVVGVCLVASVMLLLLWRSRKGRLEPGVSYTDVTITQEVQPKRNTEATYINVRHPETDAPSTFYSTIKPGST